MPSRIKKYKINFRVLVLTYFFKDTGIISHHQLFFGKSLATIESKENSLIKIYIWSRHEPFSL